jgi:hypothetical protein
MAKAQAQTQVSAIALIVLGLLTALSANASQVVLEQTPAQNELPAPAPSPLNTAAEQATVNRLGIEIAGDAALIPVAPPLAAVGAAVVLTDAIVNLGAVLWDIVKLGAPSADFETSIASALPQGVTSPMQLENWQAPVVRVYCVPLLPGNDFDCDPGAQSAVTHFFFRLSFVPGGDWQGHGKYLSNVKIEPVSVDLQYREKFSAQSQVVDVANLGTDEEPVAGMTLKLSWQSDLFEGQPYAQSMNVAISGDGAVIPDAHVAVDTPAAYRRFWYR